MTLQEILNSETDFRYRLLSRMQQDCEYYLGWGQRREKHLWASCVEEHIDYMKGIWGSFPEEQKPEWLSYEKILEYEDKMMEN